MTPEEEIRALSYFYETKSIKYLDLNALNNIIKQHGLSDIFFSPYFQKLRRDELFDYMVEKV